MATNKEVIKRIEDEINRLDTKDFTLYFFTIDSKNVPSGSLVYSYDLAYALKERGYNVCMLYQLANEFTERQIRKQKEKGKYDKMNAQTFCGVEDWLGKQYADLPHLNIDVEGSWKVGPSDFLFIPEAFSSLMSQTYIHKIPCKRYVLLQNFDYVTDFIPLGTQWSNFGITDCIATTNQQADMIKDVMSYVRTKVLPPYIPEYFSNNEMPKQLIVNVISKRQSDVNKLLKTFYWKYPVYKFVSFRDLRGMNREHYAETLKEGAITVWIDVETPFGFGALEALRANNIVIGKMPEHLQEWMLKDGETLSDNIIYFEDFKDLPDILADVIGSWMHDEIPEILIDSIKSTNEMYTKEQWDANVDSLIFEIIENRKNELKSFMMNIKNNEEKIEEGE